MYVSLDRSLLSLQSGVEIPDERRGKIRDRSQFFRSSQRSKNAKFRTHGQLVAGLIFRLDPSSPILSRSGRSRRSGARYGGEIGVRPRGGCSQFLSGCISPSPQAVSQGHEITGFGWIHARWRTYVRSIGRSRLRPPTGEILCRSRYTHTYVHLRITIEIHLSIFFVRGFMKIDRSPTNTQRPLSVIDTVSVR